MLLTVECETIARWQIRGARPRWVKLIKSFHSTVNPRAQNEKPRGYRQSLSKAARMFFFCRKVALDLQLLPGNQSIDHLPVAKICGRTVTRPTTVAEKFFVFFVYYAHGSSVSVNIRTNFSSDFRLVQSARQTVPFLHRNPIIVRQQNGYSFVLSRFNIVKAQWVDRSRKFPNQ